MSISTTDKTKDKRGVLKDLREYHQPLLNEIGVPDAVFIPKMAYRPYGKTDHHIAFFASEINKGEDVYVEFTSKELVPEDPERRLYKWRFNAHFEEEYEKTEPHTTTGHFRYLVPTEELVLIKSAITVIPPVDVIEDDELVFKLEDPTTDLPFDQMTIRDLAAILLKTPVSHKGWLNDIINNTK
jgi:hypothetical protein